MTPEEEIKYLKNELAFTENTLALPLACALSTTRSLAEELDKVKVEKVALEIELDHFRSYTAKLIHLGEQVINDIENDCAYESRVTHDLDCAILEAKIALGWKKE